MSSERGLSHFCRCLSCFDTPSQKPSFLRAIPAAQNSLDFCAGSQSWLVPALGVTINARKAEAENQLAEEQLFGLKLDWSAVATLVTGLAAVGAAYWTVKRTERAARMETTQRRRGVAARAVAVLEVARERVESIKKGETGDVLPWNAFSALSADIGLLGLDHTRIFYFIERLARDAENTANNRPDGRPSPEQINNLLDGIGRLLPLCERQVNGPHQNRVA
jgi:hypothetical protein